jgi:hypothetical protein
MLQRAVVIMKVLKAVVNGLHERGDVITDIELKRLAIPLAKPFEMVESFVEETPDLIDL